MLIGGEGGVGGGAGCGGRGRFGFAAEPSIDISVPLATTVSANRTRLRIAEEVLSKGVCNRLGPCGDVLLTSPTGFSATKAGSGWALLMFEAWACSSLSAFVVGVSAVAAVVGCGGDRGEGVGWARRVGAGGLGFVFVTFCVFGVSARIGSLRLRDLTLFQKMPSREDLAGAGCWGCW